MNKQGLYAEVTELFNAKHHIAHDIKHALRSAKLARFLAEGEGYDVEEAEIAALLHDMGRTVQEEEKGHGPAGVPLAKKLLEKYTNYDEAAKLRILDAIARHSDYSTDTPLAQIIQDADRLDGLGAVGIMRAYTSRAGYPEYDPHDIIPAKGERYTTIHALIAFQMEWLDMMNTATGKQLAKKRHAFMQRFLEQVRDEVELHDI